MNTLDTIRTARDAAKTRFDARLALVRGDLSERSVGGRIADKLIGETADVALEAADVAAAHKAIIAGTVGAIALWFARAPITSGFRRLIAWIRS